MGKVDKIKVWRRGVWVSAGRKFMFSDIYLLQVLAFWT